MSVFAQYQTQNFPHRWRGVLVTITDMAGGTPNNPKVAEGWLRTKLADPDDLIREAVAEVMVERGVTADEAAEIVTKTKTVNGFKRDDTGLYYEGRQLKAALKEAANVAANAGNLPAMGWGKPTNANYKKGIKAWFPEHVFVVENRLPLGVTEPSGIMQRFIHIRDRTGISYDEYVEPGTKISFTIESDYDFPEKQWAAIWLTAERLGLGACRSQGFGRFEVVEWEHE